MWIFGTPSGRLPYEFEYERELPWNYVETPRKPTTKDNVTRQKLRPRMIFFLRKIVIRYQFAKPNT
jgi:hypothetical protein